MGTNRPGDYMSPELEHAFRVSRAANATSGCVAGSELRYIPLVTDSGEVLIHDVVADVLRSVTEMINGLPVYEKYFLVGLR